MAQINTKKRIKPTDIIKLPWDDEIKGVNESFEDVTERAKMFQQKIEDYKNNETRIAKFN